MLIHFEIYVELGFLISFVSFSVSIIDPIVIPIVGLTLATFYKIIITF